MENLQSRKTETEISTEHKCCVNQEDSLYLKDSGKRVYNRTEDIEVPILKGPKGNGRRRSRDGRKTVMKDE
jgi:hypothetical protein